MRLPLLLVLTAVAAAPATAVTRAKRKARPARPAVAVPRSAAPAAPSAPVVRAETADDATLAGLGVELAGADVLAVRPGSRAADLGLKPGDRLLTLDRREAGSRAAAAAAARAWAPGSRLSAVVRRGEEVRALESASAPRPAVFERGAHDLSAREKTLTAERAVQDEAAAGSAVRAAVTPAFTARADQSVWVRFPKGLPASVKTGDILETETATGLTTDASLDFLSVPPKSRLWARVVASENDGETRTLRLAFFKLQPAGGTAYPFFGAASGVSGDQTLARVSAGGTLVTAAPLPEASGTVPWPDLLGPDDRLRVRLLEPVVLLEAPAYWRAGPGLWIKTAEHAGKRLFEVSHVTPGRSAEAAGLRVGDLLDAVDGRSSAKLDFAEALDRLYGAPGTKVSVSVSAAGKTRKVDMTRGVRVDGKASSALPLPVKY